MRVQVDYRLVILLLLAIAFWFSAMQMRVGVVSAPEPIVIEDNFIDFDYEQVFNLPAEEGCLEESSLPSRSPVL